MVFKYLSKSKLCSLSFTLKEEHIVILIIGGCIYKVATFVLLETICEVVIKSCFLCLVYLTVCILFIYKCVEGHIESCSLKRLLDCTSCGKIAWFTKETNNCICKPCERIIFEYIVGYKTLKKTPETAVACHFSNVITENAVCLKCSKDVRNCCLDYIVNVFNCFVNLFFCEEKLTVFILRLISPIITVVLDTVLVGAHSFLLILKSDKLFVNTVDDFVEVEFAAFRNIICEDVDDNTWKVVNISAALKLAICVGSAKVCLNHVDDVDNSLVTFNIIRILVEYAFKKSADCVNNIICKKCSYKCDEELTGWTFKVCELVHSVTEWGLVLINCWWVSSKLTEIEDAYACLSCFSFFCAAYKTCNKVVYKCFDIKEFVKKSTDIKADNSCKNGINNIKNLKHGSNKVLSCNWEVTCHLTVCALEHIKVICYVGKLFEENGKRSIKDTLNTAVTLLATDKEFLNSNDERLKGWVLCCCKSLCDCFTVNLDFACWKTVNVNIVCIWVTNGVLTNNSIINKVVIAVLAHACCIKTKSFCNCYEASWIAFFTLKLEFIKESDALAWKEECEDGVKRIEKVAKHFAETIKLNTHIVCVFIEPVVALGRTDVTPAHIVSEISVNFNIRS